MYSKQDLIEKSLLDERIRSLVEIDGAVKILRSFRALGLKVVVDDDNGRSSVKERVKRGGGVLLSKEAFPGLDEDELTTLMNSELVPNIWVGECG